MSCSRGGCHFWHNLSAHESSDRPVGVHGRIMGRFGRRTKSRVKPFSVLCRLCESAPSGSPWGKTGLVSERSNSQRVLRSPLLCKKIPVLLSQLLSQFPWQRARLPSCQCGHGDGKILIVAREDSGCAVVSIDDQSMGLPPAAGY